MDDDHAPEHLTRLIQRAITGDQAAEHQLMGEIYDDLHHLAARIAYRNDSMHPSVLIHELFLKQFRRHGLPECPCRGYFFAAAADQMRNYCSIISSTRK